MKPFPNNPRQITGKQLAALATDLDDLGDLSGIVHNRRDDSIIGGNQRMSIFGEVVPVITETLDAPDRQGTIARGYIEWKGARYVYRQVDWDEARARRGNLAANARGGDWNWDVLSGWNKETTGDFADCELAWTNQDRSAKLFTHRWNGMLRDSEREKRWHPTQKPALLAEWALGLFVNPGAIVLDPFGGAGWSVLGAEKHGACARVIEMSHEYIAVILRRYQDLTGDTPVLLEA